MPILAWVDWIWPGLWGLAVLALASAIVALVGGRSGRRVPRLAVALEAGALLALLAALVGPTVPRGRAGPVAVFRDVSDSMGPGPTELGLPEELDVIEYVFADGVAPAGVAVPRDRTDLSAVLSLLAGMRPIPSAAVIVTDGQFNDAFAVSSVADGLEGRGVPVLLVPTGLRELDARLAGLQVVSEAGGVRLAATVIANQAQRRTLRLTRAGTAEPLGTWELDLPAGQPVTVRFTDQPPPDAVPLYQAQLLGPDALPLNDRLAVLAPMGPSRLLWAAPAAGPDPPASLGEGWHVSAITLADLPATPEALTPFAVVGLADATGRALTLAQRRALAGYVRLGGGLVLLGTGPHSRPDLLADPLNGVLAMVPPTLQRRRLDVRVVLDASGSMGEPRGSEGPGGVRPFDQARQAVLTLARRHLTSQDRLMVWTFDTAPTLRHAGPGGGWADDLAASLARVRPAGGTVIGPALRAAVEAAAGFEDPAGPGERDIILIVLSDLRTEPFDPAEHAGRLVRRGARLAVAAIGPEAPQAPLHVLADTLDAPLVRTEDLSGLAELFGQFVRQVRGELHVPGPAVIESAGVWAGLPEPLPPLDVLLEQVLAPDAELLAVAAGLEGEGPMPVLARRTVGAGGRVVSLAVPLERGLNPAWARSEAVDALLGEVLHWARAAEVDVRFTGQVRREGGRDVLSIQAQTEGRPWNALELQARWFGPREGLAGQAALAQVAPGLYEARLDLPAGEAVAVEAWLGDPPRRVWRHAQPGRYPDEYARVGVDEQALAELANRLGGRVVPVEELPVVLESVRRPGRVSLAPALLMIALGLMLADWLWVRPVR